MSKRTLHDILVLHLNDNKGTWFESYKLSKVSTPFGFVGSSGERRCRELAEAGKHTVDGVTYFIEKKMQGKYAFYRVTGSEAKKPKFVYVERNGVMVEVSLFA